MILVDISTPMFEKTYDFYLEENISTAQIIDEVIGIIAEKEGYTFSRNDDMANLNLFELRGKPQRKRDKERQQTDFGVILSVYPLKNAFRRISVFLIGGYVMIQSAKGGRQWS